jgi:hypothetical protein
MTRYRFVEAESGRYPVAQLCRIAQVSRTAYYEWQDGQPSQRERDDAALLAKIKDMNEIELKLKKRGGSNKRLINMLAQATDKPKRDPDKLLLRCNPAPASPSGAFIWQ